MQSYINKHHFNRYKKFIQSRKNRILNGYTEKHHIIPKSIIINNNVIYLSAREHYIAHKLLTKLFKINTKYWFKMAKAFNSMFFLSNDHDGRYINSYDYEYRKNLHSASMKYNNPMFDEEIKAKAKLHMKKGWTNEKRQEAAERAKNSKQSDNAKKKLSILWTGSKRPKKEGQTDKYIQSASCGEFITPFGNFYSPGQASRSEYNTQNLSRHLINKYCKNNQNGFDFIHNGKQEFRGHWKKKK